MPVRCFRCQKYFLTQSKLNKHVKLIHGIDNTKFVCVECGIFCKNNEDLRQHLEANHDFENMVEEWAFENYNAFIAWLNREQKTSNVQHALKIHRKIPSKKHHYQCQGSLEKNTTYSLGRKKIHSQSKLQSACVSEIIVKKNTETEECLVTYYRTHSHEDNALQHSPIPEEENGIIVSRLASDVPFNMINVNENQDTQSKSKYIPLTLDDLESLKSDNETNRQNVCSSESQEQTTHDSEMETFEENLDRIRAEIKHNFMEIYSSVENSHLSEKQLQQILRISNEFIDLIKK